MKYLRAAWMLSIIIIYTSCVKEDDYMKYLEEGELVYPARPDSIIAYPGRDRIVLSWLLTGNPNLTRYHISWNQGSDSLVYAISERSGGTDTIKVLIDGGVPEGTYTFTIFSFDDGGHRSNSSEVTAKTFGESYVGQLPGNRKIAGITYRSDSVFIAWADAHPENVFTELHYTALDETERIVKVSSDSSRTLLEDCEPASEIVFRSAFVPDSNAIDLFYIPDFDTLWVE